MHDQHTDAITQGITVDCVDATGGVTTLEAMLGYRVEDPYAVTATFLTSHGDVVWTFARELLTQGLSAPAGEGDVHVWPSMDDRGRSVVIIELCSPDGELMAQLGTQDVCRFVSRTLAAVPSGTESDHMDVDSMIGFLLDEAA